MSIPLLTILMIGFGAYMFARVVGNLHKEKGSEGGGESSSLWTGFPFMVSDDGGYDSSDCGDSGGDCGGGD
jgi:hypothetical protein